VQSVVFNRYGAYTLDDRGRGTNTWASELAPRCAFAIVGKYGIYSTDHLLYFHDFRALQAIGEPQGNKEPDLLVVEFTSWKGEKFYRGMSQVWRRYL